MLEVEAKVRVADLEAVRHRLRTLGATPGQTVRQEDVFFRHPQRDLAAADEALRLRHSDGGLELTYKGPKVAAGLPGAKVREERTVRVGDDPTLLLAALGFVPAFRLGKTREPWRLGDLDVALDTLEALGTFVEVEAQAADGGAAARAAVAAALERLGLAGVPVEPRSYLEMARTAGVARPLP